MVKWVEDGPTCNSFGGIVDSRDEECKKKGLRYYDYMHKKIKC